MANLGVILISGQELVANLAASLSEPNDHPWAFTKWIRQMAGLTEGTYVAWIELVDAQGKQVNRFTPSSAELRARRMVVGQVVTPIGKTAQPFFDGYPFEFRFKSPDDKATTERFASAPRCGRWPATWDQVAAGLGAAHGAGGVRTACRLPRQAKGRIELQR